MNQDHTSDASGRFSAPIQNLIGYEIIEVEQDFARVRLELSPNLMNPVGIPHGGVYATLLDVALGVSGSIDPVTKQKIFAVTLGLNVNFIAPAKGNVLIAEGRRVGGGKSIYFSEGEVRDDQGTLVANATASFKYIRQSAKS